jgi:hypothetical protein
VGFERCFIFYLVSHGGMSEKVEKENGGKKIMNIEIYNFTTPPTIILSSLFPSVLQRKRKSI